MFSSTPSMSSSASAFGSPLSLGPPVGVPSPFSTPATSSSLFTTASMSSSASAFGSPLSLERPIGYPSPFSTPASPFNLRGYTPFSQTPATNASSSPGTGFGFTTASGQASMPWGSTLSGDQKPFTGGGVVPSSVQSKDFKNLFATTDSTVPNPFATPPTIRQCSFMNHVKPNLESVLVKMEEWEKSTQLLCKDVKCVQEDMKSWIERDRSLEMATQTINQLREEFARLTRSKEAIIAEYLASPDFTKRLDEEHEKRLSKIFHPCYVKALGEVQTKFPERNPFTSQRPATGWFPPSLVTTPF